MGGLCRIKLSRKSFGTEVRISAQFFSSVIIFIFCFYFLFFVLFFICFYLIVFVVSFMGVTRVICTIGFFKKNFL